MKKLIILCALCVAITPAYAADYWHPDVATGRFANLPNGAEDYIRYAFMRSAPRKIAASNCLGNMGLAYLKRTRANSSSPIVEEIKTCIAQNGATASMQGCTQATVLTKTFDANSTETLAFDMAVTNNGRIAVAWVDVRRGSPVTVKTWIRFSSDNGSTWGSPMELGSFEAPDLAVQQDIDLAVNDNGDIAALVFNDARAEFSNRRILGSPTSDQLSLIVWRYTNLNLGNPTVTQVINQSIDPDMSLFDWYSQFDLVGGTGSTFKAFYTHEGAANIFTNTPPNSTTRSEVYNLLESTGFTPAATRSGQGYVMTHGEPLWRVQMSNTPSTMVDFEAHLFWMFGNEHSSYVGAECMYPDELRDIDLITVSPTNQMAVPLHINSPFAIPICANEFGGDITGNAPLCWHNHEQARSKWEAYTTTQGLGAMVGNTVFYATLISEKANQGSQYDYKDVGQSILVGTYNFDIPESCPVPPLPKCMKKGQKNCLGAGVEALAAPQSSAI